MRHPQTLAAELVPNILEIAKNGCLAMCYLYCAGIDPANTGEYLRLVSHYINIGILSRDAFVLDADKLFKHLTGKDVRVSKAGLSKLKEIKEPAPVCYEYEGRSHWVVVENGNIVFNPLEDSCCVNKGKAVEARIVAWKK